MRAKCMGGNVRVCAGFYHHIRARDPDATGGRAGSSHPRAAAASTHDGHDNQRPLATGKCIRFHKTHIFA